MSKVGKNVYQWHGRTFLVQSLAWLRQLALKLNMDEQYRVAREQDIQMMIHNQENINIETTVSETFIAHTDNTDYFSKHFELDILQAEDSSDELLSSGNITVNGNALIANPNLPHSFTNDKVNTE